jgi:hypothetical protein
LNKTTLVLLGIAGFALFLGVMTYSMLGNRKVRVEVCVAYNGRTNCRTASGPTKDEAVRTATDNACALVASGMTDTMSCGHQPPASIKVLD